MATAGNGDAGHPPSRRFRIDARLGLGAAGVLGRGYSGRRVVIVGVLGLALIWGALALAFRDWKGRYQRRAAAGERQVAMAVDRLAGEVPPGVPAAAWARAVGETRRMLVAVVAVGPRDPAEVAALRAALAARVADARPETAAVVLARIWDDMGRRAGPALARPPRDSVLTLALTINPLGRVAPRGVAPAAWDAALDDTRALLIDLAASGRLDPQTRDALRDLWAARVADAGPRTAVDALARVWDDIRDQGSAGPVLARHPRPALLDHRPGGPSPSAGEGHQSPP
jgi:hypothetical protein